MAEPRIAAEADVEIRASVAARELMFHDVPETGCGHWAAPRGQSACGNDRTGLPDEVAVGVRYRDIHIDLRVAARLAESADQP